MNSKKKILLPELEDINNEDQDKIESIKLSNTLIPHNEKLQRMNPVHQKDNNTNSPNFLTNLMKLKDNIRGGQGERDNTNKLNVKENPKRDVEKEKTLLQSKTISVKTVENEIAKIPSSSKFEGLVGSNDNDNRKFFIRNSLMPPNLHNLLNGKTGKRESSFNAKENEIEKRNSLEEKNKLLLDHFRIMLKEASSTILIKNELPEKARKIEELRKIHESLKKEKESIERAFEEREKLYVEKINLLEKQLNDPITEDISSIQTQIKEYDNQIEILKNGLKEINESNKMEKENFYKIATEVINSKKKLMEELQDLEKHKKLFFMGNPATNINATNKPDVVVKYNFDDSITNTLANENSMMDKSFKIINNSNYNNKDNKNDYNFNNKVDDSQYNSGSNTLRNRSIQTYPKIVGNRGSSNTNSRPPHPEIKITLSSKKNNNLN